MLIIETAAAATVVVVVLPENVDSRLIGAADKENERRLRLLLSISPLFILDTVGIDMALMLQTTSAQLTI